MKRARRTPLPVLASQYRDEWLRQRIADTLALAVGNWSEAARLSGMDRTNLRRLARRVGYTGAAETWAAVEARYRAAFAALDREQATQMAVCRLPPEERGAARRARPC